jgi:hypothetical protein
LVKKLNTYFSYTFSSSIWRILAGERWLIVETRAGDTRRVDFAAIDTAHGQLLWDRLALPQSWWIGGSAITEDILILQLFTDPQKPETKGMIGVHIPSGKVVWQQPELSFVRLTTEGIIALQPGESAPLYQLLTADTGESLAMPEAMQIEKLPYISAPAFMYPVHYTEENKYLGSIVLFLKQMLGIEPHKAVDYAEFQHVIIISYYIYEHKNLSNFLVVFNKEGHVLLHERIATQLPGIGLDTFFILQHYLIVVKDKKELIAYEL